MWKVFRTVLCSALSAVKTQRDLALENLALRHQSAVYERQKRKPRLEDRDRLVWIGLRRLWPSWQTALTLVQPATVVKWHRQGFRSFWRRKSRSSCGRPRIHLEVRNLIRETWNANPTWGRHRIQSELAKLGITVSDSTVRSCCPCRSKPPSQTWTTFLANHAKDIVAIDFFTFPSVTFQVLYVLLMMSHHRRKVVHFNLTDSQSAQWTGRQIIGAFPYVTAPRYLLRDRDATQGSHFVRRVKSMGIEEVLTAPRSPRQDPYCERLIGSVRRECLDHVVVLNEPHLLRVPRSGDSTIDTDEFRRGGPPELAHVVATDSLARQTCRGEGRAGRRTVRRARFLQ